jgi:hypothetical protein
MDISLQYSRSGLAGHNPFKDSGSGNSRHWRWVLPVVGLLLVFWGQLAHARFEKLADLDSVSVSTEPNFLTNEGPQLLRTWILLDFKEAQQFEPTPHAMNPRSLLSYRSRKDYVQVDCRRNLYTELATQMFPDAEGKGKTVFESTFHRSGLPRFVTPSSHEGAVLVFLCKGIRPQAN